MDLCSSCKLELKIQEKNVSDDAIVSNVSDAEADMNKSLTVADIFTKAVQVEQNGARFYREVAAL